MAKTENGNGNGVAYTISFSSCSTIQYFIIVKGVGRKIQGKRVVQRKNKIEK